MKHIQTLLYITLTAVVFTGCPESLAAPKDQAQFRLADNATAEESEQLKLAALQGLMSAPPARALPLIEKVLAGTHSDEVKRRALFVLGQMEHPEAQSQLVQFAQNAGPLQAEAIRMIGVGGNKSSLALLTDVYRDGDAGVQENVLQAFLIADDAQAVLTIATNASSDEEFDSAARTLGAMGATTELRQLLDKGRDRESLVQAYAIAGDLDSLRQLATQAGTEQQRIAAIRNIGIVSGVQAKQALTEVYRQSNSPAIKDAALQGMRIADHAEGIVELYRSSSDPAEKRMLLQTLVTMDSELALDMIDSALGGN